MSRRPALRRPTAVFSPFAFVAGLHAQFDGRLITTVAMAADSPKRPKIPAQSIAVKKQILFSDKFHDKGCQGLAQGRRDR